MEQQCMICKKYVICSAAQTITSKGLQTLLASSISRNDGLAQKMEIASPLILHRNAENSTHDRVVSKLQKGKMNFHHMHQQQLLEKD